MSYPRWSASGHHLLLPASNDQGEDVLIPLAPPREVASWTFGRGTVLWKVWPAVLLYTLFATGVTTISKTTRLSLEVPQILITVLGVVLGLTISYRVSSGYERYTLGRSLWSDLVKNSRTFGRLVWIHIPLKAKKDKEDEELGLSAENIIITNPKTEKTHNKGDESPFCGSTPMKKDDDLPALPRDEEDEALQMMHEKRIILDLIEGFVVAVKHHLRGELGIFYEDLYPLVKPFHDQPSFQQYLEHRQNASLPMPTPNKSLNNPSIFNITFPAAILRSTYQRLPDLENQNDGPGSHNFPSELHQDIQDHHVPDDPTAPLLLPACPRHQQPYILNPELMPFASVVTSLFSFGSKLRKPKEESGRIFSTVNINSEGDFRREPRIIGPPETKYHPLVAGGGSNIPLEILRCISIWCNAIEERGNVPAYSFSYLYTCISTFEDSLSALERVLTTPIPFIYSACIRQLIWLYLLVLPFQLIGEFGWYTILGVAFASFFYLGLLAIGSELEQPFGYDENDLDLDLYCREIVHAEIESLKHLRCPNAYFPHDNEHGESEQNQNSSRSINGERLGRASAVIKLAELSRKHKE